MRRRKQPEDPARLREVLLELEAAVNKWQLAAAKTNEAAQRWAERLPASSGMAEQAMRDGMVRQTDRYLAGKEIFLREVKGWRSDAGSTPMTLEDLLRVHAPDVLSLAPLLVDRKQQVAELEDRFQSGGRTAVDDYLAELDRGQEGLAAFREELANFIASEFPLSRGDRPS